MESLSEGFPLKSFIIAARIGPRGPPGPPPIMPGGPPMPGGGPPWTTVSVFLFLLHAEPTTATASRAANPKARPRRFLITETSSDRSIESAITAPASTGDGEGQHLRK